MTVQPFHHLPNRFSLRGRPCAQRTAQQLDDQAWVKANDEAFDLLLETLDENQPFAFLSIAAVSLVEFRNDLAFHLSMLRRVGYHEAAMLATAVEWLVTGTSPDSVLDPDTPDWLVHLDQGRITTAKSRKETPDSKSYLIGLSLPGQLEGCLHARIDQSNDNRLTNYFIADSSVDEIAHILQITDRRKGPRYARRSPSRSVRSVKQGVVRFDEKPSDQQQQQGNPWPKNRGLLDFIVSHFMIASPSETGA